MRILIVEDDEALAGLLARFLRSLSDFPPMIAYSMAQALTIIESTPDIELITLDLALEEGPDETLRVRIRQIKDMRPNCLVVVVTGIMRPEDADRAIAQGADGFMFKASACRDSKTFLGNLADIGRSIMRQPMRYQHNLPLMEALTEKIVKRVEAHLSKQPSAQPDAV